MRNISKVFEEERYKVLFVNPDTREFTDEEVVIVKGVDKLEDKINIPNSTPIQVDLISTTKKKVSMSPRTFIKHGELNIDVK